MVSFALSPRHFFPKNLEYILEEVDLGMGHYFHWPMFKVFGIRSGLLRQITPIRA